MCAGVCGVCGCVRVCAVCAVFGRGPTWKTHLTNCLYPTIFSQPPAWPCSQAGFGGGLQRKEALVILMTTGLLGLLGRAGSSRGLTAEEEELAAARPRSACVTLLDEHAQTHAQAHAHELGGS